MWSYLEWCQVTCDSISLKPEESGDVVPKDHSHVVSAAEDRGYEHLEHIVTFRMLT